MVATGIPSTLRVPLFWAKVDGSQAGSGGGSYRTLLVGQRFAAGKVAAGVLTLISSADQAADAFGRGSMLHRMAVLYFQNDPIGEVWAIAVNDPAGSAAVGNVTVTGTATKAGVLALYIGGQRLQIAVAKGDTAAAVHASILSYLAEGPGFADLPVTGAAGAVSGVDLTARHVGALPTGIDLRANYRGAAGGEETPAGLSVAFTAMAGGAGVPDLASVITAMADKQFDFVVSPYTDSANLDLFRDEHDDSTGRWSYLRQLYGHLWTAYQGSQGQLATLGNGRNDPHATIFGTYGVPNPVWEIAAAVAGRAAAGSGGDGLRDDPARPCQTLPLTGILPPAEADEFTVSERNTLLYDGIATGYVSGGQLRIERLVTTYQTNAFGQPDEAFLDVQTLYTLAYILRALKGRITTKYPRHKLANDGTRFGPGQPIVTPSTIRGELVAQYAELEGAGLVEDAEGFGKNLIVERDQTDKNRLNVLYPPDLINQFRVMAVLAQFRR